MTWIDGMFVVLFACALAYALFCMLQVRALKAGNDALEKKIAVVEQRLTDARAAFDAQVELFLYDHRQLVSCRAIQEGVPPLDEPLRREEEPEREFDLETEEGVTAALEQMEGGRVRGAGLVAGRQKKYDELQTRLEEIHAGKRRGTPQTSAREPQSPYDDGEARMTEDDYAAIDHAAN